MGGRFWGGLHLVCELLSKNWFRGCYIFLLKGSFLWLKLCYQNRVSQKVKEKLKKYSVDVSEGRSPKTHSEAPNQRQNTAGDDLYLIRKLGMRGFSSLMLQLL